MNSPTMHRPAFLLPLALLSTSLLALVAGACSSGTPDRPAPETTTGQETSAMSEQAASPTDPQATETATFGAGCFWCVEAVLEQLDGVLDVRSGYMGGDDERTSYKEVCSGTTGHAEVVQVDFDPARIPYETLLDWFWRLHDPTTLNRQGADIGTQYRSVIFFHSDAQREAARQSKAAADASGAFDRPIVTEITAAATFHEAEEHHQDYYRLNASAPYCRAVIRPKLGKLGLEE